MDRVGGDRAVCFDDFAVFHEAGAVEAGDGGFFDVAFWADGEADEF